MNRILFSLCSLVLLAVIAPLASAEEPAHTKDTLDTVKANLKDGKAVLVDVREQKEWDAGHIAGALLMPKSKLTVEKELDELIKKLDKNKIIYTHCRAGKRALECGEILKKKGFDVRPLQPGYEKLVEGGLEKAK